MPTLNEMNVQENLYKKILVYGSSGAGKTRAVGALAEKYPLVWLDGENGWETLKQHPLDWQRNIQLVCIPDTPTVPMYSESVTKILTGARVWVDEETGKVNHPLRTKDSRPSTEICMNEDSGKKILVIDSLTQLVASVTANIIRGKPDDYKMERDDWGNLRTVMTKICTYIQAAKFHVVAISHEDIVEQIDKSEKIFPIGGTRSFSRNVGKFFSDVVYMEVKNRRHVAASSTTFSSRISTKSRTNVELEKSSEVKLMALFTNIQTQG